TVTVEPQFCGELIILASPGCACASCSRSLVWAAADAAPLAVSPRFHHDSSAPPPGQSLTVPPTSASAASAIVCSTPAAPSARPRLGGGLQPPGAPLRLRRVRPQRPWTPTQRRRVRPRLRRLLLHTEDRTSVWHLRLSAQELQDSVEPLQVRLLVLLQESLEA